MDIPFFTLLKALYSLTFLAFKKGWITPKNTVDKLVYKLWKGGKVRILYFLIMYIYNKKMNKNK